MGRRNGDWMCRHIMSNGIPCHRMNVHWAKECQRCGAKKGVKDESV